MSVSPIHRLTRLWSLVAWLIVTSPIAAEDADDFAIYEFDDQVLSEPIEHPVWFKQSFLDLGDDLREARMQGKKLVVYFGQRRCAYCKALMEVDFGLPDIVSYTRKHFDIVPIDIWSVEEVTDLAGVTLSAREFALREQTNFTPALIFYDEDGEIALRLRGFYPPYKFRAALEYVADSHHRRESFKDYLARADPTMSFDPGGLNEQDFFTPPPYALERSRFPAERPLIVFFEQGTCHACDVLHTGPLHDPAILELLANFETAQLDMWSDTPIITPDGRRSTAREWADRLGLFYAPTLIFYDAHGAEIVRVDSVVRFFRLQNVLQYVSSGDYREEPNFQRWRAGMLHSTLPAAGPTTVSTPATHQ